ncbi:MAG: F0F1 ATP synthase subunit epsilon [Actinomycetaceae bacterium]|nr:F0F1 ATP synthase subunit epsilon [Actinomycetaceae bacterium]
MRIEIVDRGGRVWSGESDHVSVPAHDGAMGILPGHTPVMALLVPGRVEIETSGNEHMVFEVEGGFVTVDEEQVHVVVERSDKGRSE